MLFHSHYALPHLRRHNRWPGHHFYKPLRSQADISKNITTHTARHSFADIDDTLDSMFDDPKNKVTVDPNDKLNA